MAKFGENNNDFVSTKLSPLYVLKGLHPCIRFDIIDFSDTTIHK